jgi:hypothetical protein
MNEREMIDCITVIEDELERVTRDSTGPSLPLSTRDTPLARSATDQAAP